MSPEFHPNQKEKETEARSGVEVGVKARDRPRSAKSDFQRVFHERDATSNTAITMTVTKKEETGESSISAAKKVLKANTNGPANYELPW
jgi:hypothetical protein